MSTSIKKEVIVSAISAFLFLILVGTIVSADVGVGISPSKVALQVEGGKTQQLELIVFNTGDNDMKISLIADGDIATFTKIEPLSETIKPEPKPHSLPIKNGKTFVVTFSPGITSSEKKYMGSMSAVGSPSEGSQFGGNVAVASQIELLVSPSSFFANLLSTKNLIILGIIVLIIIIIILLKRSGFRIEFKKNKNK
jgi:hypothetical protein